LSTGKNAERRKLNSSRSNRVNTGKKQINDLKDKKRSKEKDKRNSMWALQKSYNRAAKETRKKDEQQKAWKFQKEWQRSNKNKRKYN
jgi:hypothetical protein